MDPSLIFSAYLRYHTVKSLFVHGLWSPYFQKKFMPFLIIISGPCYLMALGPALEIFFSTNKTTSETRWEVSNKVDNLVIGIFYSALRIYLYINTGIYFILRDSAL